jgi:transcriptional regulator with XRE-family HTH domain
MENLHEQLSQRRKALGRTVSDLATVTGIAQPNLSNILAGKRTALGPTLEAIGEALDAKWVLIPKHLVPEVERLLSGKPIGPDDVPSTVDRLFGGTAHE